MSAALAALFGIGSAGLAQDQPPTQPKYFSRKSTFRIPVRIDGKERDSIKELRLFVRPPDGKWVCTERADAARTAFSFHADGDGEYWFCIAAVDHNGRFSPSDPTGETPGLIVVVDTSLPYVDVQPLTSVSGQPYLQCKIADANPDYQSLRVEYQAADGSWKPLENVAALPGVVRVPNSQATDRKIHVHAADLAGNVVDREIDLNRLQATDAEPAIRNDQLVTDGPKPGIRLVGDAPTSPVYPTLPAPAHETPSPIVLPPASARQSAPKPVALPPLTAAPLPANLTPDLSTSEKMALPDGPAVVLPPAIGGVAGSPPPTIRSESTGKEAPIGPDTYSEGLSVRLVNSTKCSIDFAVEETPKGISQVEVWVTQDNGQSWNMRGVSIDGKSPVAVEFPADGKYGYLFRVKPRHGLCPEPPKAGDAADGWLEVDTTKPVASLLGAALDDDKETGELIITWSASDAHLDPQPVTLYFALQPAGPWEPIVARIANTGSHNWKFPKGIGTEVFVRLEVADRAGNVTRCDTPSPVQIAAPRPKVRVLHVTPAKP
jgi:hypothetical protein